MIPDTLLLGLSLLNLLVLVALGFVAFRLHRKMKRTRKADKTARRETRKREHLNRHRDAISTWRQVEGLFSVYRMLDRRIDLPPMRFGPVSPDFLLHIIERIRLDRPKSIVECGSGTSTIVLAHVLKALDIDCHIYAIENHPPSTEKVRRQLREHDLERFVTIIAVPLVEKCYDGFATSFRWYDLDPSVLPGAIDLLIVDGPFSLINRYARYPAGPELLPRLSRDARVFIDDANRPDEREMVQLWQESHPGLAVRNLGAEKGCVELFFPDYGVQTRPTGQRTVATN